MTSIIITEKQMKVITNKVLTEKESTKETINESLLSFENILMKRCEMSCFKKCVKIVKFIKSFVKYCDVLV